MPKSINASLLVTILCNFIPNITARNIPTQFIHAWPSIPSVSAAPPNPALSNNFLHLPTTISIGNSTLVTPTIQNSSISTTTTTISAPSATYTGRVAAAVIPFQGWQDVNHPDYFAILNVSLPNGITTDKKIRYYGRPDHYIVCNTWYLGDDDYQSAARASSLGLRRLIDFITKKAEGKVLRPFKYMPERCREIVCMDYEFAVTWCPIPGFDFQDFNSHPIPVSEVVGMVMEIYNREQCHRRGKYEGTVYGTVTDLNAMYQVILDRRKCGSQKDYAVIDLVDSDEWAYPDTKPPPGLFENSRRWSMEESD